MCIAFYLPFPNLVIKFAGIPKEIFIGCFRFYYREYFETYKSEQEHGRDHISHRA